MSEHKERVASIYEAFGRGDVAAILAHLDEGIRWDTHYGEHPVPWLRAGTGHAAAQRFFSTLSEHLDFTKFEVECVLAEGDFVVALVNVEATVKTTGKVVRERREAHIWQLNAAGKVVDFQHGADSLQHYRSLEAGV